MCEQRWLQANETEICVVDEKVLCEAKERLSYPFPQEKIHENYQKIRFHPEQFHAYLLSSEIGFIEHKYLGVPSNKNEGE